MTRANRRHGRTLTRSDSGMCVHCRWDRPPPELTGRRSGPRGILATWWDDIARERAIYQALKAADEVAAALQAHLVEEHQADLERAATQSTFTNSLRLLRQARERLGQGLRAVAADIIAESEEISLRNQ
jgi:hypothetical protein